ncbi:hypothetical protein [Neptuniibacter sp.]|uniref:hypothetical protein n=1 Tax=Neptuniibacter sp. TaxID=1962643 RepID=UPI003B5A9800
MNPDLTSWLEQLTPEQLEIVKNKVIELAKQKKQRLKNPGSLSTIDLANNLGIDISSLERQIDFSIKRR